MIQLFKLFINLQPLVFFLVLCEMTSNTECRLTKRAPLEFGFATFPAVENPKRAILLNRTKAEVNLEVGLNLPRSLGQHTAHDRLFHHQWIPG